MNFKKILILLCFIGTVTLNAQEEKSEEIYTVVEQLPRYLSAECEKLLDDNLEEGKACAHQAMLNYIYQNIKYPAKAIAKGIEGTVVIRFVVDKNGSVQAAEILREIGGGCGIEALRVIEGMSGWEAGMDKGKPVSVYFNIPVKFAFEKKSKKKKRKG